MMTCQQVADKSPISQIDLQASDSIAATALPPEPFHQSFERPALILVDFYTFAARLPDTALLADPCRLRMLPAPIRSPRLARVLKLHQLAANPSEGIIKRRLAFAGAFWPEPPPLPSDEPALHEPRSLYREIGQFLIRHAIQELVELPSRRACPTTLALAPVSPHAPASAGRSGGPVCQVAECPEQVPLSLIANRVSRHATSSLFSSR
ncbi:hypothetical protein [Microvirga sp. P5_D2]